MRGGLQLIMGLVLRRRVGRIYIPPNSSPEAASARRPQSVSELPAVYANTISNRFNGVARPDAGSLKRRPTLCARYVGAAGAAYAVNSNNACLAIADGLGGSLA